MTTKSLLSDEKVCFICGTPCNLHRHHLYPGYGRRQQAERLGLWVYLCANHHNMSPAGVHNNRELDLMLRRMGQEAFEDQIGTREDFIKVFGRSWL